MADETNGDAPQNNNQPADQPIRSVNDLPDPSTLNEPSTVDLSNEIIKGSESADWNKK